MPMSSVKRSQAQPDAHHEKHRVALSSLLAAVLLVSLKLVVGLATNSLGILSEAAHSALDLVAAGITLWAVRVSGQPADTSHTYGHGKFENLSALLETLLLLAVCVWIVFESVKRLLFAEHVVVDANIWAFLVVMVSIVVDISRSRALRHAAGKHQSQALEADALHFSTDVWSSGVVLLGLIGVVLGEKLEAPWLAKADAVAALGVALIVVGVGFRLGKKSLDDLLDSVPEHLRGQVVGTTAAVAGVEEVKQVRLRRSGPEVFADVTISVDRGTALERSHAIADDAEAAVRSVLPRADVVVHIEPMTQEKEDLLKTVRVVAARHGLGAHAIRAYEDNDRRSLELHLEVSDALSLDEAHRQATEFERELRETVAGLTRIVSHLEPIGRASNTHAAQPAGQAAVRQAIDTFLKTSRLPIEPHDVEVQQTGDKLAVSFHCALDPATTITDAHELTERLERHLRACVPAVGRVVIHVEPAQRDTHGGKPS
jgi:cation diffusion facilitator family transporter